MVGALPTFIALSAGPGVSRRRREGGLAGPRARSLTILSQLSLFGGEGQEYGIELGGCGGHGLASSSSTSA
jgi:hypothetical protein